MQLFAIIQAPCCRPAHLDKCFFFFPFFPLSHLEPWQDEGSYDKAVDPLARRQVTPTHLLPHRPMNSGLYDCAIPHLDKFLNFSIFSSHLEP
jgi:hypothetical protein